MLDIKQMRISEVRKLHIDSTVGILQCPRLHTCQNGDNIDHDAAAADPDGFFHLSNCLLIPVCLHTAVNIAKELCKCMLRYDTCQQEPCSMVDLLSDDVYQCRLLHFVSVVCFSSWIGVSVVCLWPYSPPSHHGRLV